MKFFNKKDTAIIAIILIGILSVSLYNFKISLRRARDAQRKVDLGTLANALAAYHTDFGFYPPSLDGKIVACKKTDDSLEVDVETNLINGEIDPFEIFGPCEWGVDSLEDIFDEEYPAYLDTLPRDPHGDQGAYYTYISNGNKFQILTGLEGKDEDSAQSTIAEREISCGLRVCDFGRSSGVPLEKSIEEYENELLQKK